MKQKIDVNKKAEKVLYWGMWIIILLFLVLGFCMVSEAKAQPLQSIQTEISSKNPEVRKYHRKNKRGRKCSLCRKKLWKRI
jgi:cell division protein FtsL